MPTRHRGFIIRPWGGSLTIILAAGYTDPPQVKFVRGTVPKHCFNRLTPTTLFSPIRCRSADEAEGRRENKRPAIGRAKKNSIRNGSSRDRASVAKRRRGSRLVRGRFQEPGQLSSCFELRN